MKTENDFVRWQDAVVPEQTDTYMPVSHEDLLDLVDNRLFVTGYEVNNRNIEQNHDGTTIIAHFIVKKEDHPDFTQEFAVVSDYKKRKAIMFASGGHVFICGNGMVVSEVTIVRKHTSRVWEELTEKCDEAIEKMEENWEKMLDDIYLMASIGLTLTQKSELLGRMLIEEKILSITEVSKVVAEIKKPTHDYSSRDSLWELYNYCTFILKDAHIMRKTKALKSLHDFLVGFAEDHAIVNDVSLYYSEE